VLLWALASSLKNAKPIGKIFPFIAISVVMIGYPSIKSIDISASELKIEKDVAEVEQNPTDVAKRDALTSDIAGISSRPVSDPSVNTTLARAQLALGNTAAAQQHIEKALQASPKFTAAVQLKDRIELEQKLPELTRAVQQDANNVQAKATLQQAVTSVNSKVVANPETMVNVAKAQAALGDNTQAQINVDKALKINPTDEKAIQAKKNIARSRTVVAH
jgi:tetratricopeptide (TPR) repeat protein